MKLTKRRAESILEWGKFCSTHSDYNWTKSDRNNYFILEEIIKEIERENYQKQKDKKALRGLAPIHPMDEDFYLL